MLRFLESYIILPCYLDYRLYQLVRNVKNPKQNKNYLLQWRIILVCFIPLFSFLFQALISISLIQKWGKRLVRLLRKRVSPESFDIADNLFFARYCSDINTFSQFWKDELKQRKINYWGQTREGWRQSLLRQSPEPFFLFACLRMFL